MNGTRTTEQHLAGMTAGSNDMFRRPSILKCDHLSRIHRSPQGQNSSHDGDAAAAAPALANAPAIFARKERARDAAGLERSVAATGLACERPFCRLNCPRIWFSAVTSLSAISQSCHQCQRRVRVVVFD